MSFDSETKEIKYIIKYQETENSFYLEFLLSNYYNLLTSICKSSLNIFKFLPFVFDDLFNMSIFFFQRLTKKYDIRYKKNFCSYIKQFVKYEISNYIKKYITNKNKPMNFYVDLNSEDFNIEEPKFERIDLDTDMGIFSDIEQQVFRMYFRDERSISEISEAIGKPKSSIYSAINRIKKKASNSRKFLMYFDL